MRDARLDGWPWRCRRRRRRQGRGGAAQPPRSPKDASPVDLTGYWVAAITEDWRFRMVTPPKGDYASVPLNADGTKATDAWDLAKDIAGGEQCRAFGAAGIMRHAGAPAHHVAGRHAR